LLVWERVRTVLPEIRGQYKDPHLWGHLETVGNEFAEYFSGRSREAYDAFLTRIGVARRERGNRGNAAGAEESV
jgi:hypothetical protein